MNHRTLSSYLEDRWKRLRGCTLSPHSLAKLGLDQDSPEVRRGLEQIWTAQYYREVEQHIEPIEGRLFELAEFVKKHSGFQLEDNERRIMLRELADNLERTARDLKQLTDHA